MVVGKSKRSSKTFTRTRSQNGHSVYKKYHTCNVHALSKRNTTLQKTNVTACLAKTGTLRYTPAGNGPNSRQYPKSVSLYYCVKTDWLPASLFPGQLRGAQEHAGEDVLPARGGGAPDAQGLHAKAGVLALAAGACGRPCSTILTTRVTSAFHTLYT